MMDFLQGRPRFTTPRVSDSLISSTMPTAAASAKSTVPRNPTAHSAKVPIRKLDLELLEVTGTKDIVPAKVPEEEAQLESFSTASACAQNRKAGAGNPVKSTSSPVTQNLDVDQCEQPTRDLKNTKRSARGKPKESDPVTVPREKAAISAKSAATKKQQDRETNPCSKHLPPLMKMPPAQIDPKPTQTRKSAPAPSSSKPPFQVLANEDGPLPKNTPQVPRPTTAPSLPLPNQNNDMTLSESEVCLRFIGSYFGYFESQQIATRKLCQDLLADSDETEGRVLPKRAGRKQSVAKRDARSTSPPKKRKAPDTRMEPVATQRPKKHAQNDWKLSVSALVLGFSDGRSSFFHLKQSFVSVSDQDSDEEASSMIAERLVDIQRPLHRDLSGASAGGTFSFWFDLRSPFSILGCTVWQQAWQR